MRGIKEITGPGFHVLLGITWVSPRYPTQNVGGREHSLSTWNEGKNVVKGE